MRQKSVRREFARYRLLGILPKAVGVDRVSLSGASVGARLELDF
jgi:hypothetical protein